MIGGAGPESNLPAVEIVDPMTGQFLIDVQCGNGQSRKFWSSHAGI